MKQPAVPIIARLEWVLSPRVRAGASLKLSFGGVEDSLLGAFPPRSCGGLIEARSTAKPAAAAARFPPAFVRGPH